MPLLLVFSLMLAACSNNGNANVTNAPAETEEETSTTPAEGEEAQAPAENEKPVADDGLYSIEDFSNVKKNEGEPIKGGSITFGLVSDTPFEGTLNWNFYSGDPDAQVLSWFDEGLLTWDKSYVYTNDGAATYEASEDGRTFTFTIKDNVNWQDGKPVTAEDWLFAHEVIGNPKYDGPRYDSNFINIVGMKEYHEGKAKTISGIEVLGEKKLKITYVQSTPSLLTGGIWTYPLAKHIFGNMPVEKISSSPEVREKPIGFGPYKVESIVPGESVVSSKTRITGAASPDWTRSCSRSSIRPRSSSSWKAAVSISLIPFRSTSIRTMRICRTWSIWAPSTAPIRTSDLSWEHGMRRPARSFRMIKPKWPT